MIGPNTSIAVRIHNVEYLVSSSNVDYAIFCIDRGDRSCRWDTRRNRIESEVMMSNYSGD